MDEDDQRDLVARMFVLLTGKFEDGAATAAGHSEQISRQSPVQPRAAVLSGRDGEQQDIER
jgi:hypothetical protein